MSCFQEPTFRRVNGSCMQDYDCIQVPGTGAVTASAHTTAPNPSLCDEAPSCPEGQIPAWDGTDKCCTPQEYATQPDGSCQASYECFEPPDYTSGPGPVAGGVDPSFCEAPPEEAGDLACLEDGVYEIYDTVTGEVIVSGVAEADLPEGIEIVAADDPRCGPAVPPTAPPPGLPGVPGPGLPGVPGVGPIPTVPIGPTAPLPGAIPLAPTPGLPGAQAPFGNPLQQTTFGGG
jgi:hypothetical protein